MTIEYNSQMKLPVVFFLRNPSISETLLKEDSARASYVRLAELAEKRGIDLRFVLGEESYVDRSFISSWKYVDGQYIHIQEKFAAQMIYAKNLTRIFDQDQRVNNEYIENVCTDKVLTAQLFPDLFKKTLEIDANSLAQLDSLSTSLVVLKPRFGANGENVRVLPKSDITKDLLAGDTYIIQEFIDSSKGIPNLISQRHEMRIYMCNGKILAAYLRLPVSDSYLANIAQGAQALQIENDQIPDSFISVTKQIDEKFSEFTPRSYVVDIMYEDGRPWVIELNNSPGLPDVLVQPLTDIYLNSFLDLLS